MLVIEDAFNTKFNYNTCIVLGSFDGLHLGHMKLINKMMEISKKENLKSMVLTFKNHPLSIIDNKLVPKLIMDNEVKINVLKDSGVNIVNMINFDTNFMKIPPQEFVNKIIYNYNPKYIIVGFNYKFGYKNSGDVKLLDKISFLNGVKTYIIAPVKFNGKIVSSSRIRNLIAKGDIVSANKMLTRPFMLQGKVISGKKIGRSMGFPTVNLDYDKRFVLPSIGVYYTVVEYNKHYFKGITNVGYNPTVHGTKLSIETNILNFSDNVYNKSIKINFINKIRNEKKFDSIDELKVQLQKDKEYAKKQEIEI